MHKQRPKWLALTGKPEVSDNLIRLETEEPPKKIKGGSEGIEAILPWAMLRSDIYFQDGDIKCEFFIEKPESKVQFRLGNDGIKAAFVGTSMLDHAYGIAYKELSAPSDKIITRSLSGYNINPQCGIWLPLHIRVRGSSIELFISDIRVANSQIALARSQLELSLRGIGEIQVRNIQISAVRPQAFVVMQFTEEYNQLYKEVISPVCAEFGYEVIRGDNIYTNGLIIQDITKSIQDASVVIADITPNNANVYYEVGYAHGIEKATILLSDRRREKLPFDISGFRLLFYDNTIGGKSDVENALRRHLEALQT